ncbi:AraC family transcriptional regulator [Actibacterium atlanticum]|uniref:AraC family transcriptional regulator n=1 Tax=Actibacterium atlanticum TaxID=1461693 RepID=A0A058ZI89_9RHOB|nr:AraC family transcriptional regulator [Actibacterium atlanticum]KCV80950.1 AraC family transcriptional regulator [Actibacterium atlanticum]
MSDADRLTTLIQRFQLNVRPAGAGDADIAVVAADDQPCRILFSPGGGVEGAGAQVVFAAKVDWASDMNPLVQSLPRLTSYDLADDPDAQALVAVLRNEVAADRCGAGSVLNRLCEVLLVRLLRHLMQSGVAETGLLAGLADPRLSRAIVAMHDRPQHDWDACALAQEAGLSLSRFTELFSATVGESPMAYLRRWRLILARQDLARGVRIGTVARRYGYSSPEGFSRAFRRQFNEAPIQLRFA